MSYTNDIMGGEFSLILARNLRFILLHKKFLQFDWLRAVVVQLNLKYLHVEITKPLRVVVCTGNHMISSAIWNK